MRNVCNLFYVLHENDFMRRSNYMDHLIDEGVKNI
jgi:hypothetical protein